MRGLIRALSDRAEFALVFAGAFGLACFATLLLLLFPTQTQPISGSELWRILVYEALTCAALAAFLHERGWSLRGLGLSATVWDTFVGFALGVCVLLMWVELPLLLGGYRLPPGAMVRPTIPLGPVLLLTIINPVFEETFVTGYVVSALQQSSTEWTAVSISVAIRVLCHLSQGASALLFIAPIGLVFAVWYARGGRLWPLIVAHGVLDFAALAPQIA